jgi:hypothetical protein
MDKYTECLTFVLRPLGGCSRLQAPNQAVECADCLGWSGRSVVCGVEPRPLIASYTCAVAERVTLAGNHLAGYT